MKRRRWFAASLTLAIAALGWWVLPAPDLRLLLGGRWDT